MAASDTSLTSTRDHGAIGVISSRLYVLSKFLSKWWEAGGRAPPADRSSCGRVVGVVSNSARNGSRSAAEISRHGLVVWARNRKSITPRRRLRGAIIFISDSGKSFIDEHILGAARTCHADRVCRRGVLFYLRSEHPSSLLFLSVTPTSVTHGGNAGTSLSAC